VSQPITVGIPFAKGSLHDPDSVGLCGPQGEVLLQTQALARWSDGSVKWLLLDFLAKGLRNGTNAWTLTTSPAEAASRPFGQLKVTEAPDSVVIETGCAAFHLDRNRFKPFTGIKVGGEELLDGGGVLLTGANGRKETARVKEVAVEARGPVRATVRLQGRFTGRAELRFVARLSFYAGTGLVRLTLTVHNPQRARHRGGLWDLGDSGSVLFRDLSVELRLRSAIEREYYPGKAPAHSSATTGRAGPCGRRTACGTYRVCRPAAKTGRAKTTLTVTAASPFRSGVTAYARVAKNRAVSGPVRSSVFGGRAAA